MVNPSKAFWHNKKVLITGHTGFKGAWLTLWLQEMGAVTSGLSLLPPKGPNLANMCGLVEADNSFIGNVCDANFVNQVVQEIQPDIILHLAAQALVRRSYADPIDTFATNVMGTLNVLNAATQCETVRAVLNVTTDKCYENKEWIWPYRENEAMGGHDPYSASKACSEIATAAWRSSLNDLAKNREKTLSIGTARAGNVIGGGDWAEDRLIPDFVTALSAGKSLLIRSPHATRPWQHVLEPLSGYLLLAEKLWKGEAQSAWNFGPGPDDVKPVSWVVDCLSQAWGPDAKWSIAEGDHPHEATFLSLDASKARQSLNWYPRLDLATALQWTVSWYKGWLNAENPRDLISNQIRQYLQKST